MNAKPEHKSPPGDRIAKVIARAGLASRREAERMIAEGRVAVNGAVIDRAALNVTPSDKITVDGKPRLEELVCDGALVSTPAGSTAYNYSAHGPILPIGSEVLALTAVAPFRPRRWRGALLPKNAHVRVDVLQPGKRPVMADADSRPVFNVHWVEVKSEPTVRHRILFDPGHGLEERLIQEQFV